MKLYDWQKEAIEVARNQPSLALFAEVGTGKSCVIVQILRQKFNMRKRIMKTLILGPVAVVYNWQREVKK